MDINLAIVIPAYKIEYFQNVLESLSRQTDKRFNVYIGIDASNADFESVIGEYANSLNIFCKRFEDNLGGKDLVAQWNRCLELIQGEEWIWLFSDDDMMTENCVESFYQEIEKSPQFDLYHFDVDVIDEKNNVVKKTKAYPEILNAASFLKQKNAAKLDSFVVEYIFRRTTFEQLGGFQHFDMAWGTDIATWAKLGKAKGIKTINGAKVLWRQSNLNITPSKAKPVLLRKLSANVCFFNWCGETFKEITVWNIYYYMSRLLFHYSPYLKIKDCAHIVKPLYYTTFVGKMIYGVILVCFPLFKPIHKLIHL